MSAAKELRARIKKGNARPCARLGVVTVKNQANSGLELTE